MVQDKLAGACLSCKRSVGVELPNAELGSIQPQLCPLTLEDEQVVQGTKVTDRNGVGA